VGGFLEDLNIEMPPMQEVNAGRLLAYIDQNWDRRRSLQQRIRRAVPQLQQRALQTHGIVLELLNRADVRTQGRP
jgi:hypothetical protein